MRNHNSAEHFAFTLSRKRTIEAMCTSYTCCIKDRLENGFKKGIRSGSAQHCPLHVQVLLRLQLGEAVNDETYSGART